MKILFVTARLCFPLNTGGKIRTFHILRTLAKTHDVTLISYFGNRDEERYFSRFEQLGIKLFPVLNPAIDQLPTLSAACRCFFGKLPLTVAKYYSVQFVGLLKNILEEQYDVIHCEHLHVWPMLSGFNRPFVLDEHNVESQIAGRYALAERNIIKRILLEWNHLKLKHFEMETVKSAQMVLAVSDQDRQTFHEQGAVDNIKVLENGVDIDYFSPTGEVVANSIVFVGSMDWKPNLDGMNYFLDEIFHLVRQKHPDVTISVVGKDPPESLKKRGKEMAGVTITGTVDDVRPFISKAAICIVPLLVGGGTRLKVLEAFAMEKAVVSTSLGCEGITCVNGEHIIIADTSGSFADAITALLEDENMRKELGSRARKLVESEYSWDVLGEKLCGYYMETFYKRG